MNNTNRFLADIQYENSYVSECTFHSNLIAVGKDAVLHSGLQVGVSTLYRSKDGKRKLGRVQLLLDGNLQFPNAPDAKCTYRMVVEGEFSTDVETEDARFTEALWINGATALYSIARAKMEVISSTIFHSGKICLPMVNILQIVQAQSNESRAQSKEAAVTSKSE